MFKKNLINELIINTDKKNFQANICQHSKKINKKYLSSTMLRIKSTDV